MRVFGLVASRFGVGFVVVKHGRARTAALNCATPRGELASFQVGIRRSCGEVVTDAAQH